MNSQDKVAGLVADNNYQDHGWAWVVMLGAFMVHFLTAGCEKAFSLWYIEILDTFSTTSTFAAGLGGISAAVRLILAPLVVILCDNLSIRTVVITGGIVSSLGLLISAWSATAFGLVVGYGLIYGFGLTMVFTPALVVCTVYFEKRRATALSLSLAGAGFGAFLIPQMVVYLISNYGYRGAMGIMSAFVLNYCVSGVIFRTPLEVSKPPPLSHTYSVSCLSRLKSKLIVLKLFRDSWFMLFITSFVFNMMGSGPVTTLIIHYSEELGTNIHLSVFLLAIEGGVQVLARSLSGLLFDINVIKKVRGIVWCGDIMASASVVCLFVATNTFAGMAVLMGLRGLFLAIYISHQTLMTCDMCDKPKDSGLLPHAIGMTQLSKGVGILIGALISGYIKDATNDYRYAFLFLGLSQFLGSIMALVAISHRKHGCCSFGDRVHDLVAGGSGDSTEEGTQDSRVSLLHGERTPRSPYTDAMESLTNGRQAGGGDYDADDDSDGGYICADYVLENTEDEKENDSQSSPKATSDVDHVTTP